MLGRGMVHIIRDVLQLLYGVLSRQRCRFPFSKFVLLLPHALLDGFEGLGRVNLISRTAASLETTEHSCTALAKFPRLPNNSTCNLYRRLTPAFSTWTVVVTLAVSSPTITFAPKIIACIAVLSPQLSPRRPIRICQALPVSHIAILTLHIVHLLRSQTQRVHPTSKLVPGIHKWLWRSRRPSIQISHGYTVGPSFGPLGMGP